MAQKPHQYDPDFKAQAVKLAKEMNSVTAAARELGISKNTLFSWVRRVRIGEMDIGAGAHTPQTARTLNEELIQLREQVKDQEKEIKRLKKENTFLEEASAFFAASRLKSAKTSE